MFNGFSFYFQYLQLRKNNKINFVNNIFNVCYFFYVYICQMEDGVLKYIIQMIGFKMEEKEVLGKLFLKLDCIFIKSEVSIEIY